MKNLRAPIVRLMSYFRSRGSERNLTDEIETHLRMHIDDNLRSGMTPQQARRDALMKLGGIEQTKEAYRERRGLPFLDVFSQDLRFASRMLAKNSGFAVVAVLTLALGISANATIFSFVNAVLYKRPPIHDPGTVLVVYGTAPSRPWGPNLNPVSPPNYFTWQRENRAFSEVAAAEPYLTVNSTGDGDPERITAMRVTPNFFMVIGIAPEMGRSFAAGEDRLGHAVALLDYRFWVRKFGANPGVVGQTIRLNGEVHTIIGVLPERFQLMSFQAQIWLPLLLEEGQQSTAARQTRTLFLFGRLKPSVTTEQAQADIRTLAAVAAHTFPDTDGGWGANALTLQAFQIQDFNAQSAIAILLSAVGFVLLIACANIAGLLIARASGRAKEMAVRIAIGAGRARVVRQLMTEALLIAGLGAAVGWLLALGGSQVLHKAISFNDAIRTLDMGMDWRVLAFVSAAAVASAILFGLAPALRAWAVDVFPTLKNESGTVSAKSATWGRSFLVTAEVSLAVILLIGSGLLIKAFLEGMHRDLGFRPQHLLTAQITLPDSRYKDQTKQIAFYLELISRLEHTPGAVSAATTNNLPAAGARFVAFAKSGQESLPPSERGRARYYVVSPGYFQTIQAPLVAGRSFRETDTAVAPAVAVVSQKFVERFFPAGDALGKQIRVDSGDARASQWREIVGIVEDVRSWPLNFTNEPEVYEPAAQHPSAEMSVVVRAAGDPGSLGPGLREAVWSLDPEQPVGNLISMPDLLANEVAPDFVFRNIMAVFAGLALLLSGIGIYGLVAYSVGQRRREMGIRVALGAAPGSLLGLVFRDGLKLAAVGALLGMLVGAFLPRIFQAIFYDFHVANGWLFGVVPLLVALVAMAACYLPARRAAGVDPIVALRYE
jgi:predicted permease